MDKSEFIKQLTSKYLELFPLGYINAREWKMLGNNIIITVGLIADQNDCSSRIRDNDIGFGKFLINCHDNGTFTVKPLFHGLSCVADDKYSAMSFKGKKYRKSTKKDLTKVLDSLMKHFSEFKQTVIDNKDKIYRKDNYKKYIDAIS